MSYVGKWFGFGRDERYDRGVRAFDRGLYEEALVEFESCLATSRDPATLRLARYYHAECHTRLGVAALRSGLYAAAVNQLERAVAEHPDYPDLRLHLAQAYRKLGDRKRHEEELAVALRINPKYAAALMMSGVTAYEDARYDEALAIFEQAAAIEPGLRNDRYRFALEAHAAGDTARALAAFEGLTPAGPEDANAHAQIAGEFARQGKWAEAAGEYERALDIAPRYADVRFRYGEALLNLDQIEYAAEQFRIAIEINPDYADAHAGLGVALRRLGRLDEAREAFARALDIQPHHVVAETESLRARET
jgi:tetratricopeptide (TPR) repeat protein